MVIYFNSEKARNQLMKHDVVVTCRKRRKQFGMTTAIYKNEDNNTVVIGRVHVQKLCESISLERRHNALFRAYLYLSGFKSVEEWKEEVKRLNKNRWMPDYLIFLKVTMKDDY